MKRPKITIRPSAPRPAAATVAEALRKLRDALAGLGMPSAYPQPQPVPVRVVVTHRRAFVATRHHHGGLR